MKFAPWALAQQTNYSFEHHRLESSAVDTQPLQGKKHFTWKEQDHSLILLTGGGGGVVREIFQLGSEILAKRDFFWVWKTRGFFRVAKKAQGFFGVLYFSDQVKSTIT